MESGGKLTLWNKCFSLVDVRHSYWHPIIATSFSQDNSSEFSAVMPDEVRDHLTRDQRPFLHPESLQIFRFTASSLQIHCFMTVLLLFSSLTHLLQGSGQRTPDTRSEIIPSSRITPDPSDSQLLLFSSLTHLLQGSDQRTPDTRSEIIPSSRITPDPSDSQLLLFSSLTHLLQGSGQRTPDTRSETIPSSRITPDPQIHSFFSSDSLLHDGASSLQFTHSFYTGFRSEDWDGYGKSFILCSVTHFCVVFYVCFGSLSWWKIQIWSIIRFLTEAVRFRFFYLLILYSIHDAMHLKTSRTSGRNTGPQH